MTRVALTLELKARILDLARTGASSPDICRTIGGVVQARYIDVIISEARRADPTIPFRRRRSGLRPLTVVLSPIALAALETSAARRRMGVGILAALVLEAAANDKLIDAIIDDGVGPL